MTFRYPDKPALSLRYGSPIPRGEYLCQFKPDGERCIIRFEAGQPLQIVSRFNRPLADAEDAQRLAEQLRGRLEDFGIEQATFDAEHICKRRGSNRPEVTPAIWLLDCVEFGFLSYAGHTALERWRLLCFMECPTMVLGQYWTAEGNSEFTENNVKLKAKEIPAWIEFVQAAAFHKPELAIEGVVLKRTDSKLIGSTVKSALNPGWIKVKW